MKIKTLSKTLGVIMWIAMIGMNRNILMKRRNRWTKWRPFTIQLRKAQRKNSKQRAIKATQKNNNNNNKKKVSVLGYIKKIDVNITYRDLF